MSIFLFHWMSFIVRKMLICSPCWRLCFPYITVLFFLNNGFAQDKDSQQKSRVGMTFYIMNYMSDGSTGFLNYSFNALRSYAMVDMDVRFERSFNTRHSFQIAGGLSTRYSDIVIDSTINARILEGFYGTPVLYFFTLGDKKTSTFNIGLGTEIQVLIGQKFLVPDGITLPQAYSKKYGFGSYGKFGLIIEFSASLPLFNEQASVLIGIRVKDDINTTLFNLNNVPVTTRYQSFGLFLGLRKSL